jgi:branched-chain amino acid transport system substrate-binding protein
MKRPMNSAGTGWAGRIVRAALGMVAAAPWACWAMAAAPASAAQDVKVALIVPLSGRWARQGQLKKMGAEMAVEEINAQGGIKALGGAKIVLVPGDAGDSVEKAVSATQRVLTREKVSAAVGAWLSSFTLGATEVSERLQVPWLTLSFADNITERGFTYVFQVSPVASRLAEQGLDLAVELAKTHGASIKRVALVGDSTASTVSYFKALREKLLPARGIAVAVDEIFTPPLSDASPIAQKLRAAQPDLLINGATNFPDIVQMLQKTKEFGVKVPAIGVGGLFTSPEFVDAVGQELLYGFMATAASHTVKGQADLLRRFKERTKERFMVQDSVSTYADLWIIKEALERAGSDDPRKVRDAIASIDLTAGPAAQTLLPNRIRFDATGRRVDASPLIVQWQGAEAFTVFPERAATRKAVWIAK